MSQRGLGSSDNALRGLLLELQRKVDEVARRRPVGTGGGGGTTICDCEDGVDGIDGTNGTDGIDGTNGTDGADGADGLDGADGIDGAWGGAITIPYLFDTTTTDSDPGSGNLRLDNATLQSATVIRADYLDSNAASWEDVLVAFDESLSDPPGYVRLVAANNPAQWLLWKVVSVADMSGYVNITVDIWAFSATAFLSNGEACYLLFDRTGDAGADGSTGGAGHARLTAPQSIPDSVGTVVNFDTQQVEGAVTYNTSNDRFEIGADGWYVISGNVRWASPASTANLVFRVALNPDSVYDYLCGASQIAEAGEFREQSASITFFLSAGDDLHLEVFQDSGAAVDLEIPDASFDHYNAFSVVSTGGPEGPPGTGLTDGDKGDITVSGSGATWTIDNDVVSNAKLANVSTATFKGRVTAATGDPEDLTGTQATTLLDVFTSGLKGLAPLSGGGTTNFLRADGTWAAPPGGGGGTGTYPLEHSKWRSISGAASNLNAAPAVEAGTMADPKLAIPVWSFDPGQTEHIQTDPFVMPADYASGGTLVLKWMANDTGASETCRWGARISAITAGDTDTILEHALAAAATVETDVNTAEANRMISSSITLTMDSAAAGDVVTILLFREGGHANDDLSSAARLVTAVFEYAK